MSPWRAHYKAVADLLPSGIESLLNIGCGSGLELDFIFTRFPALQVTGIDLSRKMLDLLVKKHGDKQLQPVKADYFTYDFGEQKFDAAVSFQTLHHFSAERKQTVFEKIFRVLKKGGYTSNAIILRPIL